MTKHGSSNGVKKTGSNGNHTKQAKTQTQAIQADRERYLPRGVYTYHDVFPASASGARITDVEGASYLDFAGGIGVMNVGHSHPAVVAAIQEQAALYTHTCAHVVTPPPYIALAKRLAEITPGKYPKKTLLVNSGAEAVENAIKIARAATGRAAIISFENSFHGRTNLALSLTGKVRPYRANFGPFANDIHTIPYPYCYQCAHHDDDSCCREWETALERAFLTRVAPEQVAAVIVEPVQGEGGFVVPPADFLPTLREFCSRHGILLIADEVQTGFGRTGRMFAVEHYGVEPDLMLIAKSLAGGMPLAAVVGTAEIMDAPLPGGLGGTYGGNPVACAAALAVIEVFEREGLVERGQRLGAMALERMREWQREFPLIGDVRGLGAMVAMELVSDRATRKPASAEAAAILKEARARGLLLIKAGLYDNVIRLLMPLVTTDEEMAQALDILHDALSVVSAASPAELAAAH
ncbi:MAG TPA: 4-aminobutyrate--2-oxoglutarate transaminase [Ktedonobacterales bacterium]|jgi:4-aminobutyrate aminotransferase / (S)-3-amino-2-methylpropionate transaminase / 5-aminovalerate transaminase|nr:4-aminobutyrate--2-oxoglutarate transaminase [Ktedonobacterales bacterium]